MLNQGSTVSWATTMNGMSGVMLGLGCHDYDDDDAASPFVWKGGRFHSWKHMTRCCTNCKPMISNFWLTCSFHLNDMVTSGRFLVTINLSLVGGSKRKQSKTNLGRVVQSFPFPLRLSCDHQKCLLLRTLSIIFYKNWLVSMSGKTGKNIKRLLGGKTTDFICWLLLLICELF